MNISWDFSEVLEFSERLLKFDVYCEKAAKEIAEKLHQMLINNTPVDFGMLQAFWKTEENYSYVAERVENGFEITLVNKATYALWVNDGHKQRPGRFIPGYWMGNHFRYDPTADGGMRLKKSEVKGRFFVETSIAQLENSVTIESIVQKQLKKCFRWCVDGK